MYLRKVIYQMKLQIESRILCFHLLQRRNLVSPPLFTINFGALQKTFGALQKT